MRQRLRWLFLGCILFSMFQLGTYTALADTTNMVVQVRKTGGSALNGAQVCVGQQFNPCPNTPIKTKGNGIAVIKMGVGDEPYEVLVTVTHLDYKTQTRVVNFQPGQPSVRFILEPNNVEIPVGPLTNLSISGMEINGQATHTTSSKIRVGWHTNNNTKGGFNKYWLSLSPDFSGVQAVNVSPRTSGTSFFTIPSPVSGTVYTVYLKVAFDDIWNATQSASITFGSKPAAGPTTKTFKLGGANQIDAFLQTAIGRGYRFASRPMTLFTECRARTFRYLRTQSFNIAITSHVTCRFDYFRGKDLASGWRLQSVNFRKRCPKHDPQCPLDKFSVVGPKNTIDPSFMVLHQPLKLGGDIELIELVFVGPASATTVTEALQEPPPPQPLRD